MLLLYKMFTQVFDTLEEFKNISCYYYIYGYIKDDIRIPNLKTSHVTIIWILKSLLKVILNNLKTSHVTIILILKEYN